MKIAKGDMIHLDIESLNSDGIGVGRHEGIVVFVADALPCESVSAKIIKPKRSYAVARMEQLLKASPQRRKPPCPYHKRCGGCSLQHMEYAAQLEYKQSRIEDCFSRIGRFDGITVPEVIPSTEFGYRNKATFPISMGEGGIAIGPYEKRSHNVVDVAMCMIQHEGSADIINAIRQYAESCNITAYDEHTGKGLLRHIVSRKTDSGIVVTLVCTAIPPRTDTLVELLKQSADISGVVININDRKTNVILGDEYITLYGESCLTEHICGQQLRVSPASFLQVNHDQCERLYSHALEAAQLDGDDIVMDAYCGIGSMSLLFARHCSKLYGIECVQQAVDDARANASLNGISNAEFLVGNAEDVIPSLLSQGVLPDVLLLDPPRKGCEQRVLDAAIEAGIKRIVYVSCNPSTLARDAALLAAGGYTLDGLQGFDMFPQTTHVEAIVLLQREG